MKSYIKNGKPVRPPPRIEAEQRYPCHCLHCIDSTYFDPHTNQLRGGRLFTKQQWDKHPWKIDQDNRANAQAMFDHCNEEDGEERDEEAEDFGEGQIKADNLKRGAHGSQDEGKYPSSPVSSGAASQLKSNPGHTARGREQIDDQLLAYQACLEKISCWADTLDSISQQPFVFLTPHSNSSLPSSSSGVDIRPEDIPPLDETQNPSLFSYLKDLEKYRVTAERAQRSSKSQHQRVGKSIAKMVNEALAHVEVIKRAKYAMRQEAIIVDTGICFPSRLLTELRLFRSLPHFS